MCLVALPHHGATGILARITEGACLVALYRFTDDADTDAAPTGAHVAGRVSRMKYPCPA